MRRSSPALFELMRRGDASSGPVRVSPPPAPAAPALPPAPGAAARVVPPPPPIEPEPVAESRPAGRRWAYESGGGSGLGRMLEALQRRLTVSVSTALIAAGGVLALCVIVWSAAYNAGRSQERKNTARELGREAPPVVREPLADRVPVNPDLLANADRPASKPAPATAAPPPAAAPSPPIQGDPREPGRNYYQLLTTDRDEAERLIAFLGENGVSAFAVGVDRNGARTNNPARFMVFCARGITRDELRERAPARTELDQAIATLGQRWKKENRGSSDLSGAIWSKYSP